MLYRAIDNAYVLAEREKDRTHCQLVSQPASRGRNVNSNTKEQKKMYNTKSWLRRYVTVNAILKAGNFFFFSYAAFFICPIRQKKNDVAYFANSLLYTDVRIVSFSTLKYRMDLVTEFSCEWLARVSFTHRILPIRRDSRAFRLGIRVGLFYAVCIIFMMIWFFPNFPINFRG